MLISSTLKIWYLQNKRDLPWRNSCNPYHIWVSEVILQQTRIAQGLPYYERFIHEFPDITSLANAPQEKLLKVWQGLGYYSRALNLQKGARYLLGNFNGKLPSDYSELLTVSGIGEYTASAIASIAFNQPYAVVDGNVNRVVSRIFGVYEPVNSLSGKRKIMQIANELMDREEPGIYNQAIMEFGALLCTPAKPLCDMCPINELCYAYNHDNVSEFPVKLKKTTAQKRYFHYLVIICEGAVVLKKRTNRDIWHGLYEFPLIEAPGKLTVNEILGSQQFKELFKNITYSISDDMLFFSHKLTHQFIETGFVVLHTNAHIKDKGYIKVPFNELPKYPVSRLIQKYFEKHGSIWLNYNF